ncbi:hypothetical protein [Maribacter cobaltidurans]|nr:hypothetical protein [Maribacter cobaltidurans]
MKRCLLMFGILLVVVIVASILEHKTNDEALNKKLAMGNNEPSMTIIPNK